MTSPHFLYGQYGRHSAGDIFECIFMNEKFCVSIRISLKIDPNDQIDNKSALVQVMAWHRKGDKPFTDTMLTQLVLQRVVDWERMCFPDCHVT